MAPAPRRFYTSLEVAKHDSVDDCWLSLHGIVLDVTELLKVSSSRVQLGATDLHAQSRGAPLTPLISTAGPHRRIGGTDHQGSWI